ncbi:MAG: hypothetical protein JO265_05890 [Acidimicrobiia bacterium]|nr:hypothetical protein [Acidimicrobiia bacterium]
MPDVRRDAFRSLAPDVGPPVAHPTAGAICAGARPVLVAYNVRLAPGTPVETAREIASAVRGPAVRALGLDLGGGLVQVSMNLLDWRTVGPAEAYDAVVALAGAGAGAVGARGVGVSGAEVVGLVPEEALVRVPEWRWAELGLSGGRTIEAAVRRAGFG